MTDQFTIRKATRQGFKPLIGLYAESGCGKSYSSLLLARGLVGPTGNITMIDTEGGRGGLYSDVIPGGYNILDLQQPFSPNRYVQAIEAVEKSQADVLIIDSMSHEWEGLGGVLHWATENEANGKKGRQIWKDPKIEHERMVGKLLQTRLPIICCMRAKHLLIEKVDPKTAKKEMIKDPDATPKQADDFISNMTFHAEILPDHSLRITKVSHTKLGKCFPEPGHPIEIKHGELLAQWCAAPGGGKSVEQSADVKALKAELWSITGEKHMGKKQALYQWLVDEALISDTETLDDYATVERLNSLIAKVKAKLERETVGASA